MQSIAAENDLPETAFVLRGRAGMGIRWCTPTVEVDLCGHATLAAAHVLFAHEGHPGNRVQFASQSGPLAVEREAELLVLDFPSRPPRPCPTPDALVRGLGPSASCGLRLRGTGSACTPARRKWRSSRRTWPFWPASIDSA